MSYEWSLYGVVEKPFYVPSSHFNYTECSESRPTDFPSGKIKILSFAKPFKGDYPDKLYIAEAEIKGIIGSVIVNKSGKYISVSVRDFIWIEPDFRGFGIGSEHSAENIINNIQTFISVGGMNKYNINKPAIAMMKKAHRLLIDRGAITHDDR